MMSRPIKKEKITAEEIPVTPDVQKKMDHVAAKHSGKLNAEEMMAKVRELSKMMEDLGARQFQSKQYLKWHDAKVSFLYPQIARLCEQQQERIKELEKENEMMNSYKQRWEALKSKYDKTYHDCSVMWEALKEFRDEDLFENKNDESRLTADYFQRKSEMFLSQVSQSYPKV